MKSLHGRYFGDVHCKREHHRSQVAKVCRKAFFEYELRPVNVPIRLIRSNEFAQLTNREFHLSWRELTDDFEFEVIQGEHETILYEPAVHEVARLVSQFADR